jgi:hypothetical protein
VIKNLVPPPIHLFVFDIHLLDLSYFESFFRDHQILILIYYNHHAMYHLIPTTISFIHIYVQYFTYPYPYIPIIEGILNSTKSFKQFFLQGIIPMNILRSIFLSTNSLSQIIFFIIQIFGYSSIRALSDRPSASTKLSIIHSTTRTPYTNFHSSSLILYFPLSKYSIYAPNRLYAQPYLIIIPSHN